MNLFRLPGSTCFLGFVLILAGPAVRADQVWTVSLDTSQLATGYTGPFALDFELVGSNGNTVTLSNFSYDGGSAGPGPRSSRGERAAIWAAASASTTARLLHRFQPAVRAGRYAHLHPGLHPRPSAFGWHLGQLFHGDFRRLRPSQWLQPYDGNGRDTDPHRRPEREPIRSLTSMSTGRGQRPPRVSRARAGYPDHGHTGGSAVPEPSSGRILLVGLLGLSGAMCCRHQTRGRSTDRQTDDLART